MYKRASLVWGVTFFSLVTWADHQAGDPPGKSMGALAWIIALAPWLIAWLVRFVVLGVRRQAGAGYRS